MKRLIIAATIPLAFLLTSCGEQKINPNDYVSIEYSGYSEDATATMYFDAHKLATDYPEAFRLGKNYAATDVNRVINCFDQMTLGQLSKTEGISNGDEVVFSWDENALSELEDKYKVKWSGYEDIKETASGIPELEKLNPFDYIDIYFEGKSPKLALHLNTKSFLDKYDSLITDVRQKSGMAYTLNFQVVDYTGAEYAKGDKITVQFYVSMRSGGTPADVDTVDYLKQFGYLITQTEKEYTVE